MLVPPGKQERGRGAIGLLPLLKCAILLRRDEDFRSDDRLLVRRSAC